MLNDLLEDLALVHQVEDALVSALGFEESTSTFALRGIELVDVVLYMSQQVTRDEIGDHAHAIGFDPADNFIDIVPHLDSRLLNDRLILHHQFVSQTRRCHTKHIAGRDLRGKLRFASAYEVWTPPASDGSVASAVSVRWCSRFIAGTVRKITARI